MARPLRQASPRSVRVQTMLTPEEAEALSAAALAASRPLHRVTVSDLIRDALLQTVLAPKPRR